MRVMQRARFKGGGGYCTTRQLDDEYHEAIQDMIDEACDFNHSRRHTANTVQWTYMERKPAKAIIRTKCEYCGAPLRVLSDMVKCEYCGQVNQVKA